MSDLIQTVTVGEVQYNIAQCSAVNQWWIFKLFSRCSLTPVLHAMINGDKNLVVATLLGSVAERASTEDIDKLSNFLLAKCSIKGSETALSIDDFQGRILELNQLHIAALEVNFGDFTQFLNYQSPKVQEQPKNQP